MRGKYYWNSTHFDHVYIQDTGPAGLKIEAEPRKTAGNVKIKQKKREQQNGSNSTQLQIGFH